MTCASRSSRQPHQRCPSCLPSGAASKCCAHSPALRPKEPCEWLSKTSHYQILITTNGARRRTRRAQRWRRTRCSRQPQVMPSSKSNSTTSSAHKRKPFKTRSTTLPSSPRWCPSSAFLPSRMPLTHSRTSMISQRVRLRSCFLFFCVC